MTQGRPDQVFSALSDPTRRRVMQCLSEEGTLSAGELAERIPVSRQAVLKHLTTLDRAGLIDAAHDGRRKMYRLTPAPLSDAMSWMAAVGAQWDERLDALRRHLQKGGDDG